MYLSKLILHNFQKHENLTLEFTNGVNYIYGSSDSGKSCIRRAIGFLFFGDPRSDSTIRKEGSKQTSVIGVLDNGVEIERVKSSSINRYVVRIPGQKELVYDSIGAVIPEDVKKYLQVDLIDVDDKTKINLNIAEQISMPFLTDIPGSARIKLFNRLTGNDLLDVIVQNINKEILGINRELKNAKEIIETNQPQVEKLTSDIGGKREICERVIEARRKIKEEFDEYVRLKELKEKLDINRKLYNNVVDELSKIKIIDTDSLKGYKDRIDALTALKTLKIALFKCKEQISTTQAQLDEIKAPELNIDGLRGIIKGIDTLKSLSSSIKGNRTTFSSALESWSKICAETKGLEEEYKSILKELGVCPVCKQKVTEDHLTQVHL